MNRAIKTLINSIEKLQERMKSVEKDIDEPEMLSDYEFSINEMGNLESEVIEHQKAITILLKEPARKR